MFTASSISFFVRWRMNTGPPRHLTTTIWPSAIDADDRLQSRRARASRRRDSSDRSRARRRRRRRPRRPPRWRCRGSPDGLDFRLPRWTNASPKSFAKRPARASLAFPPEPVGSPEPLGGGSQFALADACKKRPKRSARLFASFAEVVHRPRSRRYRPILGRERLRFGSRPRRPATAHATSQGLATERNRLSDSADAAPRSVDPGAFRTRHRARTRARCCAPAPVSPPRRRSLSRPASSSPTAGSGAPAWTISTRCRFDPPRLLRPDSSNGARAAGRRLVLLTTQGETALWNFAFRPGDVLLVGREFGRRVRQWCARRPTRASASRSRPPLRSLNVGVAAALALGEALRQLARPPRRAIGGST